jgi:hypothetical protein
VIPAVSHPAAQLSQRGAARIEHHRRSLGDSVTSTSSTPGRRPSTAATTACSEAQHSPRTSSTAVLRPLECPVTDASRWPSRQPVPCGRCGR